MEEEDNKETAEPVQDLVVASVNQETKMEEEDNKETAEPVQDLVVASVKQAYTVIIQDDPDNLKDQKKFTYAPGNVIMPRHHAENWFSVSKGTEIIGIPDDGTVKGHTVKMRMQSLIWILTKSVLELESVESSIEDEASRTPITKAADLVAEAKDLLESLHAS